MKYNWDWWALLAAQRDSVWWCDVLYLAEHHLTVQLQSPHSPPAGSEIPGKFLMSNILGIISRWMISLFDRPGLIGLFQVKVENCLSIFSTLNGSVGPGQTRPVNEGDNGVERYESHSLYYHWPTTQPTLLIWIPHTGGGLSQCK